MLTLNDIDRLKGDIADYSEGEFKTSAAVTAIALLMLDKRERELKKEEQLKAMQKFYSEGEGYLAHGPAQRRATGGDE